MLLAFRSLLEPPVPVVPPETGATMRQKIKALLVANSYVNAALPDRIYNLRAPQFAGTDPYLILSMPTHNILGTLKGTTNLENGRVRFDLYGVNYHELDLIKEAIVAALNAAASLAMIYVFGTEMYEDDTQLYHLTFDFSAWNDRH